MLGRFTGIHFMRGEPGLGRSRKKFAFAPVNSYGNFLLTYIDYRYIIRIIKEALMK